MIFLQCTLIQEVSKNKNKIDNFLIDIERMRDAIAISETS